MILLSCKRLPEQQKGTDRRAIAKRAQEELLLSLLPRITGRSCPELPALSHFPGGKPYFPDVPHFFFNFSDSGSFLVLAAGTASLGIDLQKTASYPRYLALARRFFAKEEAAAIASLPEEEGRLLFFRKARRRGFLPLLQKSGRPHHRSYILIARSPHAADHHGS